MVINKRASYKGLSPASEQSSAAGKGASKKSNTRPEILLRKAMWKAGLRYIKNVEELPGKPDIVFRGAHLAIFCDGDFWHGKNWASRKKKLKRGSNADYWISKIESNIKRDKNNTQQLKQQGWTVLRFWESDIYNKIDQIVSSIIKMIYYQDKLSEVSE